MTVIDVNCAIGAPLKSYRFTDAEGLIRWMDEYRITTALAYHAEALREPEMGNELMLPAGQRQEKDLCGKLSAAFGKIPAG